MGYEPWRRLRSAFCLTLAAIPPSSPGAYCQSVGPAVPGEAVGQHGDPMHPAVPFTRQHRAWSHVGGQPVGIRRALCRVFG